MKRFSFTHLQATRMPFCLSRHVLFSHYLAIGTVVDGKMPSHFHPPPTPPPNARRSSRIVSRLHGVGVGVVALKTQQGKMPPPSSSSQSPLSSSGKAPGSLSLMLHDRAAEKSPSRISNPRLSLLWLWRPSNVFVMPNRIPFGSCSSRDTFRRRRRRRQPIRRSRPIM